MMNTFVWTVLVTLAEVLSCCFFAGCGAQDRPATGPSTAADAEVIVFAAASTKELLEDLAATFSPEGKITITINPGPSSSLANQILEGAPADLFLSASSEWATRVTEANLAGRSLNLLTNTLVLVVPTDNPAGVESPDDLLSGKVKHIALAGEKVPAGKYANQALRKLGLLERLTAEGRIARGQDVRAALSYVERGEAEAGIVYATDAKRASNVTVVHEFDPALHDEIVYVAVLLEAGASKPDAKRFYEFLSSGQADAIYRQHGFDRIERQVAP